MEAVHEEIHTEIFTEGKRYTLLNYEDVKKISDELIEQNMEAYRVLANA